MCNVDIWRGIQALGGKFVVQRVVGRTESLRQNSWQASNVETSAQRVFAQRRPLDLLYACERRHLRGHLSKDIAA